MRNTTDVNRRERKAIKTGSQDRLHFVALADDIETCVDRSRSVLSLLLVCLPVFSLSEAMRMSGDQTNRDQIENRRWFHCSRTFLAMDW